MSFLAPFLWLALVGVPAPLTGTVVDHTGKPVEGATVWLVASNPTGFVLDELARARTGTDGTFAVDVPAQPDMFRRLTVWAYAPGARIVFASLDRPAGNEAPLKLVLGPPSKVPVRVVGSDGRPVAGAKVRLRSLGCSDAFRDMIETSTDGQGLAVLEGVVPAQVTRLDVTAAGLGTQTHRTPASDAEKTVHLMAVGRIAVRLVSDDAKDLAGWTVTASSRDRANALPATQISEARGQSDAAGELTLGPLSEGFVTFRVEPPEHASFLAVPPDRVVLGGGRTVDVKIPLKKAVKVVGSVVLHGTGKPAAGVTVNLFRSGGGNRRLEAVTDADGRFSCFVLPGQVQLSLNHQALPMRYFAPSTLIRAADKLAVGEETHTVPPLEVWAATVLKGIVVDEAGKPVGNASVRGVGISRDGSGQKFSEFAGTDERGAFAMGHVPSNSAVTLRASLPQRADSPDVPASVDSEGVQDGPVKLQIGPRQAGVSLRGRVLGPEGRPVPEARVQILFRGGGQLNASGGYQGKPLLTAADGTFATPDDVPVVAYYRLSVLAPRMEPARGDWSAAPGGRLPDLVMRRVMRLRAVNGRVIDARGAPVAGAEVFQAGDGPRRTSGTTDADGRFTVPGIFDAPGFVFVKKNGYRFTGRRIGTGEKPLEIVLGTTDGPPPAPLKTAPPPLTRAEERAKARAVVAPLWEQFMPGPTGLRGPFDLGSTLALVDTDRMVEMIENQVVRPNDGLLAGVALGLLEQRPRDAVAALEAIEPPELAATALLDLHDEIRNGSPAVRRDVLEGALTRARGGENRAQRAALLARVADRWFELGDVARARPLLDEARAELKRVAGSSPAIRADVAAVLARVDLEAALALLGDRPNPRALAEIARRIAATDPAGAVRVFERVGQKAVKLSVLADTCAGMAAHDLPKALELAGPDSPGIAALAVAAAARSKAQADPAAARALLAEAFDRLEQVPDGQIVVPAIAMARLLPIAIEIDPGRSPEYLWRAIAARPPRISDDNTWTAAYQGTRYFRTLAALAALVAPYDREAAAIVFAPVSAYGPEIVDQPTPLDGESLALLQAAALFDARAATTLLAAVSPYNLEKVRIAIARALALPAAARRREALRVPGQPDLWPALLDDRSALPVEERIKP